jgi:hypothetical protein
MTIDIAEETMTALAEYALVPIAFPVDRVLDVTACAEGGCALSARRLEVPYVKDYDAVDGERTVALVTSLRRFELDAVHDSRRWQPRRRGHRCFRHSEVDDAGRPS